jgi:hypothetical protein
MPTFTDDVVVNDANNGTQVVANGTSRPPPRRLW